MSDRKTEFNQKTYFDPIRPVSPKFSEFEKLYNDKFLFEKYAKIRLIESGILNDTNKHISGLIMQKVMDKLQIKGVFEAAMLLADLILQQTNYLTPLDKDAIMRREKVKTGKTLKTTPAIEKLKKLKEDKQKKKNASPPEKSEQKEIPTESPTPFVSECA